MFNKHKSLVLFDVFYTWAQYRSSMIFLSAVMLLLFKMFEYHENCSFHHAYKCRKRP